MGFPAVSPKWELEPQDLTILHKVQFTHITNMKIPSKHNIIGKPSKKNYWISQKADM